MSAGTGWVLAAAALFAGHAVAGPPPAPEVATIAWPIPWEPGQVFVYASETIDRAEGPDQVEGTRSTEETTVEIRDGTGDGLVQAWTYRDFGIEVLAGDGGPKIDAVRSAAEALAGVPLVVQLDEQAAYAGILNLDEVASTFKAAMRPVIVAGIEQGIAESLGADADPASAAKARAEAMTRVDGFLDRIASPAVLEGMLKRQLDTFNAFTGLELEAGQAYEAEVQQQNPLGTTPIPARIEFALFLPEAHPDHGLLEWSSEIDPGKGLQAVWEIVEGLTGEAVPQDARDQLPAGLELADEGFILFDLASGVPEMFEMERTVTFGEHRKYDRTRMQLVSGEHIHEWNPDPATER